MNAGGVDQACKSNAEHISNYVLGVANELVTRRYKPPTHA
jgi:hypothetical protein